MTTPSEERRARIVAILREGPGPTTGAGLSTTLGVSRQAIVNDIAILRASGEPIHGSPRGYFLGPGPGDGTTGTLACLHDREASRDELEILVDRGITVLDVVVEHELYGEVQASMMVASRADVDRYMDALMNSASKPLSSLTSGVHVHHVRAPTPDALEAAKRELAARGYLLED
jgi:transcriptional regulator of NAD metabolism